MPQQHKAGNKAISVWLSEEDRALLARLCELGLIKDRSDFIRQAIAQKAKEEGITNEQNAHTV